MSNAAFAKFKEMFLVMNSVSDDSDDDNEEPVTKKSKKEQKEVPWIKIKALTATQVLVLTQAAMRYYCGQLPDDNDPHAMVCESCEYANMVVREADALKQTYGILDVEGIVEAFDAEEINPN